MPFTKRKRILNFGYRCAIDLKIKIYLTPTVQFKKETNIKNVIMLAATVIFLLLSRYILPMVLPNENAYIIQLAIFSVQWSKDFQYFVQCIFILSPAIFKKNVEDFIIYLLNFSIIYI